ncbi:RNA pseudouridine synthase [Bacillus sp. TS-2]|nr:RNA pseudouridine synthase [Bacillus sp. TS-2]
MRLDKLLANMGYGSRKEVKQLLKSKIVTLNDQVVKDGSLKVDPAVDQVKINEQLLQYKKNIYIMMNKPKGVICATEDEKHRTVLDLLNDEERIFHPFPVGRLDKDTEGLLLLTNDGAFSHSLMSPKKHVDKCYQAKIKGEVTERDVQIFANGVTLEDGYKTKPAHLTVIESGPESFIELTITEGKYHQVKRMFQAVGKYVLQLKRIKISVMHLDKALKAGEYRELTNDELKSLNERQT